MIAERLLAPPAALGLALALTAQIATAQVTRGPSAPSVTPPPIPTASAIVPALDPLIARPTSELADAVSRYAADRSALFRRYDVQYSKSRGARAREFSSTTSRRISR